MQTEPENSQAGPASGPGPIPAPTPIAELLETPDFPRSALGKCVDIGGYTGVVTDVVNQSLKVRSPEGALKSFNANGLRRIYLRVIPPEPPPSLRPSLAPTPRESAPEPAFVAPPPKSAPLLQPDFTKPVKDIALLVNRPDYPQGILGEHVLIADYTGVVVQIVNRSLKVRSQAEITRSYNADALRKLYGESVR